MGDPLPTEAWEGGKLRRTDFLKGVGAQARASPRASPRAPLSTGSRRVDGGPGQAAIRPPRAMIAPATQSQSTSGLTNTDTLAVPSGRSWVSTM